MPNLWSRMNRIVTSNGHAALDKIENPLHMSQGILREVDDALERVRHALLTALSRFRQLEQACASLRKAVQHTTDRARKAVQQGDDARARDCLALQLGQQRELDQLEQMLEKQQTWLDSLRTERAALIAERQELASQARLIQLSQGLVGSAADAADPYTASQQRRERMANYAGRTETQVHELQSAQTLRAEEAGPQLDAERLDVDAALEQLKRELQENAA